MNRQATVRWLRVVKGPWAGAAFLVLFAAYLSVPAQQVFSNPEREIFTAGDLVISAPTVGGSATGVAIRPLVGAQAKKPPRPSDLSWMEILANVAASGPETKATGTTIAFERHITITVSYPAAMEAKHHTSLENLRLLFWDPATGRWVVVGRSDKQGKTSPSYDIGPFRINKAKRTISVTIKKWPLGDPCMGCGG